MSDKETFLRQIIAAPDDLILKSVYADWLRENGETEFERDHAEFIWQTLQPRKIGQEPFIPEWLVRSLLVEGAGVSSIRQQSECTRPFPDEADLCLYRHVIRVDCYVTSPDERFCSFDFQLIFRNGLLVDLGWHPGGYPEKILALLSDSLLFHHPVAKFSGREIERSSNWKSDLIAQMRPRTRTTVSGNFAFGVASGTSTHVWRRMEDGSAIVVPTINDVPLLDQIRTNQAQEAARRAAEQVAASLLGLGESAAQTYASAMGAGLQEMAAGLSLPPEILEAGLPLNSRPRVGPASPEIDRLAAAPIERTTGTYVTTPLYTTPQANDVTIESLLRTIAQFRADNGVPAVIDPRAVIVSDVPPTEDKPNE